jgi:hypothetical protein
MSKKCIILPDNKLKNKWDLWVVLLLSYTALIVPVRVCFIDETSAPIFILDLVIDISFFLDIVLTFFTAYTEKGALVINK